MLVLWKMNFEKHTVFETLWSCCQTFWQKKPNSVHSILTTRSSDLWDFISLSHNCDKAVLPLNGGAVMCKILLANSSFTMFLTVMSRPIGQIVGKPSPFVDFAGGSSKKMENYSK